MTANRIKKIIEGYNYYVDNFGGQCPYRRNTAAEFGYDCARRIVLRQQLEVGEIKNMPSNVAKKDIKQILISEKENDKWFTKQAGM